jgi:beta-glucosidase
MIPSEQLLKPSIEEHVNNLLAQMTLEEKIGQMNQYFSFGNFDPEMVRQGKAGSVINAAGALSGQGSSGSTSADVCNHIQQLALESRLKIPQLFGRDVIHGYRTVFPIPLGQAAAWNTDLAEQAASVAAKEATSDGIKWTFAPMLDIARDPRWGRIAEGNGEDPVLGSHIAAALVRGFQGTDMSAPDKLIACAKHYVGYGSAEGGRDYDNGEISEPTLRDIYLPPFKAAVDAGVGTLMSAFLDLNGVPATANRKLLNDVLRGEWGFDGFVVSDWASVQELVMHGVAEDAAQAAAISLHAGVDMDMVCGAYLNTLEANLNAGKVTLEEIEEAVRRILRIKHLAGLFDQPFTDPERAARDHLTDKSRELAQQFARETMVLLKNKDGFLPLDNPFKKILVAGPFVHGREELYGTWTPDGRPNDVTMLSEALKQIAPKEVQLRFTDKSDQAALFALESDAVVLVVGEHPRRSGENSNVSDLGLPPGQAELIDHVVAQGKPVVLVVFAGRPLAITRQVAQTDAVLYAWHPGIEGGAALGEILFGRHSPSGRLPVTFPRATGQIPIYYNSKPSGRPVSLGQFISRYVDLPNSPLFPFGYGLTYTDFAYSNLQMSSETLRGSIQISADVMNTGKCAGNELVQLYVRDLVGSLTRPIRELKDYERVELQPGESRRVAFTLREEQLAFTRSDGTRGVEPGNFHVWVAPDSVSGLRGKFRL